MERNLFRWIKVLLPAIVALMLVSQQPPQGGFLLRTLACLAT